MQYDLLETAWGWMVAVWSAKGLYELSFPKPDQETAILSIDNCKGERGEEPHPYTGQLQQELKLYWQGFPVEFTVPVDWSGYTPFQKAILSYTATIPYGETRTYRQAAEAAGSPKAVRAAGGALHINRTPIVVPCHRVIGSHGGLTGFGGGLELKQALLLLESPDETPLFRREK